MPNSGTASLAIAEWREFASFTPCEQRYIKRSLDVGLDRQDAFKLWARNPDEAVGIRDQYVVYQELKSLRQGICSDTGTSGANFESLEPFMGKLIRVSVFDMAQERLDCFSSYRFLYERLLGAEIRPWLPSAFCAAAALPQIRPERRKNLLRSISEAAAAAPGWSIRQPGFYPEWVERAVA
ncbi:MAG: hypothetical protein M3N34_10780 [Pseudomonadota bacterium]|nr:hypothetical protein [Pseudomonadota bacterium]